MSDERAPTENGRTLGACPTCDMSLPVHSLLIEYNSDDGKSRMFAECPRCEIPVHPE